MQEPVFTKQHFMRSYPYFIDLKLIHSDIKREIIKRLLDENTDKFIIFTKGHRSAR